MCSNQKMHARLTLVTPDLTITVVAKTSQAAYLFQCLDFKSETVCIWKAWGWVLGWPVPNPLATLHSGTGKTCKLMLCSCPGGWMSAAARNWLIHYWLPETNGTSHFPTHLLLPWIELQRCTNIILRLQINIMTCFNMDKFCTVCNIFP